MTGRTSLTKHIGRMRMDEEPDLEGARALARNSYVATGGETVLINKKWLRNWQDRELLDTLARAARIAPERKG